MKINTSNNSKNMIECKKNFIKLDKILTFTFLFPVEVQTC